MKVCSTSISTKTVLSGLDLIAITQLKLVFRLSAIYSTPSAMAGFCISNGDSLDCSYLGRSEIPCLKSSDLPSEFSIHFLNSSTAFFIGVRHRFIHFFASFGFVSMRSSNESRPDDCCFFCASTPICLSLTSSRN